MMLKALRALCAGEELCFGKERAKLGEMAAQGGLPHFQRVGQLWLSQRPAKSGALKGDHGLWARWCPMAELLVLVGSCFLHAIDIGFVRIKRAPNRVAA